VSEGDEPTSVGDALAKVRAEFGLPATHVQQTVESHWTEIVGEDVAAHAVLLALRDGVLTIGVDSAPWGTQLTYLEATLVERANAIAGPSAVRSIAVRVRPTPPLSVTAKSRANRTEFEGRSGTLGDT
jgi:predicted nucleic acid-binding Zn ribbon protein